MPTIGQTLARTNRDALDPEGDRSTHAQNERRAHQQTDDHRHPARWPRAMPFAPEHGIAIERRPGNRRNARPIQPTRGRLLFSADPRHATGRIRQTAITVSDD